MPVSGTTQGDKAQRAGTTGSGSKHNSYSNRKSSRSSGKRK